MVEGNSNLNPEAASFDPRAWTNSIQPSFPNPFQSQLQPPTMYFNSMNPYSRPQNCSISSSNVQNMHGWKSSNVQEIFPIQYRMSMPMHNFIKLDNFIKDWVQSEKLTEDNKPNRIVSLLANQRELSRDYFHLQSKQLRMNHASSLRL